MFDDIYVNKIFSELGNRHPLIHCITNPISINDCANAVLALGGKPVMAEHPGEVAQITKLASALSLNLGNITDARMESMKISANEAQKLGIPIVLDLVGITCSDLRLGYVRELLEVCAPSVIKGNMAEIKALCGEKYDSIGIDAVEGEVDTLRHFENRRIVSALASDKHCVVMASGKCDIISDGEMVYEVGNGSEYLPLITGTGCMLGVITGTFLSVAEPLDAAVLAALVLGICGEIAEEYVENTTVHIGLGTFHIALMDALSTIGAGQVVGRAKLDILNFLGDFS